MAVCSAGPAPPAWHYYAVTIMMVRSIFKVLEEENTVFLFFKFSGLKPGCLNPGVPSTPDSCHQVPTLDCCLDGAPESLMALKLPKTISSGKPPTIGKEHKRHLIFSLLIFSTFSFSFSNTYANL